MSDTGDLLEICLAIGLLKAGVEKCGKSFQGQLALLARPEHAASRATIVELLAGLGDHPVATIQSRPSPPKTRERPSGRRTPDEVPLRAAAAPALAPKDPNNFEVEVPASMTANRAYALCQELFRCDIRYISTTNLDVLFNQDDRTTEKTYRFFVRGANGPGDLSAQKLRESGRKGITLIERLLCEAAFFNQTGRHLDLGAATICAGSQAPDGRVPRVAWENDVLVVAGTYGWYAPAMAHGIPHEVTIIE